MNQKNLIINLEKFIRYKNPGVYKFFCSATTILWISRRKIYLCNVPKLIISSFGLEDGWDKPIGLKYEIIPMVKPFALYSGNLFQGKVLHDGRPASKCRSEVEFYNEFDWKSNSIHITQVVKTDEIMEFFICYES